MDNLDDCRLNENIILDQCYDQCYMTGMRGGELSSYGCEKAHVAACCKQGNEYSVSLKVEMHWLAEEILDFHEKFCFTAWDGWLLGCLVC
jgi:hypothetical protein